MKFKRGCVIRLWHALLFFSSDDTEFIRRFPAEAITHGFSRMRPVRSFQIPLSVEYIPQISQIYTDFFHGFFCHADFADDADFFLIGFFYSSDDTEFIRRFPAQAITHGFSRMRPVRSLQIPPESGICPTDFTDLHRLSLLQFHSLPSLFSLLICLSFLISHLSFLILSSFSFLISHF